MSKKVKKKSPSSPSKKTASSPTVEIPSDFPKLQSLEDALPALKNAMSDLPEDKKVDILQVVKTTIVEMSSESFSGPIPHPNILKGYKDIQSDAPERILKMAEQQAAHRQKMEIKIIDGQLSQTKIGQFIALFLTLVLIGVGTYLAIAGHALISGGIFTTTIIAIVYAFALGKRRNPKDEE